MKTYLECIPCFFKQALDAARLAKAGPGVKKQIICEVANALQSFPMDASPPEMGMVIYRLVKEHTRKKDPYKKVKDKSNRFALSFYPLLKNKVRRADDSLLTALELAIAGNIIDYGVKNSLDVDKELKKILHEEKKVIKNENRALFCYEEFKRRLSKADSILYLGDNAGETVFDRIFIEEVKRLYARKRIIYAVKEKPVINDSLVRDAYKCGIDKVAEVISNGIDAPGTILRLCSPGFKAIFKKADMVISKGQGNFESLSREKAPISFLFMAKCPVVAEDVGCNIGDIILLNSKTGR